LQGLFPPKLIASGKGRRFLPDGKPNRSEQLQGRDVNDSCFECPVYRYGIPQVPNSLGLGFEIVNLPGGIVIQHQPWSTEIIRALSRFGKGLIRRAAAVDDDARPRSGSFHSIHTERPALRSGFLWKTCPYRKEQHNEQAVI